MKRPLFFYKYNIHRTNRVKNNMKSNGRKIKRRIDIITDLCTVINVMFTILVPRSFYL
jgi:hypothetical protein